VLVVGITMAAAAACDASGQDTVEYGSPGGVYTVQLIGRKTAPKIPFFEHTLRARVMKGSERIVDGWEVHFADWFDSAFEDQYVGSDWPAENVFRLKSAGSQRTVQGTPEDHVTVENNAERSIRFLSVRAADSYLIFDLESGSKLELKTTAQWPVADFSAIEVAGTWANGTTIPTASATFEVRRPINAPPQFVIDIQPTRVRLYEVPRPN